MADGPRWDDVDAIGVSVDIAMFTIRLGRLCVLLVHRASPPFEDSWALPGGRVHVDEALDDAAARVLAMETGVASFPGHLEQLHAYGAVGRDPRMRIVSIAHVAFAPNLPTPRPGPEANDARWWPVADLRVSQALTAATGDRLAECPDLAFDHATIIGNALDRVQSRLEYTTLAARFVEEPFTLPELHRVYQAVWGAAPDLGNFRRKVLTTEGFVVEVGVMGGRNGGRAGGRPPMLYRRGPAELLHPAMLRVSRHERHRAAVAGLTAAEPPHADGGTALVDALG